jgi:hypothetical protein
LPLAVGVAILLMLEPPTDRPASTPFALLRGYPLTAALRLRSCSWR